MGTDAAPHEPAGYSHADVWRIAGPMVLSSATTPLLGMVDTAVIGHLSQAAYLGAAGAGATIFSVLFMGTNFLRMGTTGIAAQAFGARDGAAARELLGQSLLTALAFAAAMLALQPLILRMALALIGPGPEVARLTAGYFSIRVWSAPASLANFVVTGWLLGMQNARGPLAIALVTNTCNIVLDLLFVPGLGLAVRGVALATLIAEYAGLATGLLFVRRELARFPGAWNRAALLDLGRYAPLVRINGNLWLRTLSLMFVFAFVTARGARAGDAILAANALLMNLQFCLSYVLDGIANAAEALVGKAIGERRREAMLVAVRRTRAWSGWLAAGFTVAYLAGGDALIRLLTTIPEVASAAGEYLPWLVISPLISVWSFLYDGVYVGATRPREMLVVMAGGAFLVFLPAWFATRSLGNHGLWLAFILFMLARGIGMHVWFRALVTRGPLAPGRPCWAGRA